MADNRDDIYQYQPLWEDWYIDMPIGKGSFGSVYKISREDMGHKYTSAVKIISIPSDEQYKEAEASFGGDEASLSGYFEDIVHNIINEINLLYTLKGNSNIVSYEDHKVVEKEDRVGWDILIRMEYVTSLRKYIAGHQMSKREIIQLGIDICSALELCSRKGIIHRDIKDDNIFVNQDGVFKLGDFGISRELSKSGRAASMRGTPLYMAPEVYRGDKYDAAVDIYSLGIVMYRMLNHGRMPFMPPYPETIRFKDSEAALEKRMSGQPLPLPDQAGAALGKVIIKACAYKAGDRYASATEMKRDLEKVLGSLSDAEKSEPVTMLSAKSPEPAAASDPALTSPPEPKEKTVSIFGSGLTEPISEHLGKPKLRPETESGNSSIESMQESVELPRRDLNKTESIFASRAESAYPATDIPASADQLPKNKAGSKKANKPSKTVIAAIVAIAVVVLILAVAMNRTNKTNRLRSWLPLSTQSDQTASNTSSATSQDTEAQPQAVVERAAEQTQPQVITFRDENFEKGIRTAIGKHSGNITVDDVKSITTLDIRNQQITNISGIEYFVNLNCLDLMTNQINDISPLRGLINLNSLYLANNQINDITPLVGLTKLDLLQLGQNNQISDYSPLRGLTNLKTLFLGESQISDISPLSGLTNLETLRLDFNQIRDISPLSRLTNLKSLGLPHNQISDISPLRGLTNLNDLCLCDNQISNISPLSGLTKLTWLALYNNQIRDISPLKGLTNLNHLELARNPIDDFSPVQGYYDQLEGKDFSL